MESHPLVCLSASDATALTSVGGALDWCHMGKMGTMGSLGKPLRKIPKSPQRINGQGPPTAWFGKGTFKGRKSVQ